MKAYISSLRFPPEARILCISDIHGNLPYLKGLLEKVRFSPDDQLMILGDLLEKGPDSLGTLRYIMQLCSAGNVHVLSGNCDGWFDVIDDRSEEMALSIKRYLSVRPNGLIGQMCACVGFDPGQYMDVNAMRQAIAGPFAREFDFLRSLPQVIDTPNYTFVHGGLPEGSPEDWDAWQCMKFDSFMTQGRRFEKWVICGHWPVMLYRQNIVDATPVIDRSSHIISIDGGCVLKDDGQLNALIIPRDGSEDFSHAAYDAFPQGTALDSQEPSPHSWYIRWGDAQVQVLERGGEFCRCRHIRTGYEMDILTKYVYGNSGECTVNDCTDYKLPIKAGDRLSLVERSSRGFLVKHNGVSGWYCGRLAMDSGEVLG